MLKEAIEKILDLKRDETIDVDGRTYWTRSEKEVEPEPLPLLGRIATVPTLEGFISYFKQSERDPADLLIVVKGPTQVALMTRADEQSRRDHLITANYDCNGFSFDQFMDITRFIINVHCQFVDSKAKTDLLASTSQIRGEEVTDHSDDGITQKVAKVSKFGRIGEKEQISPIVTLAPKRTFADVEQPESQFLFRLEECKGDKPLAALFEADGGAWRLDACRVVADWLRSNETVKELGIPVIG